ncbi:unnamed protein product [Heterobilharzia americana]|nr:unnamed protein product [Heterobilharzia americana]
MNTLCIPSIHPPMSKIGLHFKCQHIRVFFFYSFLFYYIFLQNGIMSKSPVVSGLKYTKRTLYLKSLLSNTATLPPHSSYHHFYHSYQHRHPYWANYSATIMKSKFSNDYVDSSFGYHDNSRVQCDKLPDNLCLQKYKRFLTSYEEQPQSLSTVKPKDSDTIQQHFNLYDAHKYRRNLKQLSKFNEPSLLNKLHFYTENKKLLHISNLIESNQISLSKWLYQLMHQTNLTKILDLTGKLSHLILDVAYERVKFILLYEFKQTLQKLFEIESSNGKYYTKSSSISRELWRNLIYNNLYAEYIINEFNLPIESLKPKIIQSIFNEIDYNGDGKFTPSELEIFLQFYEIIP